MELGWQPGDFGQWFDEKYLGYQCENHRFLWNYDRIFPKVSLANSDDTVYVVEGFKACLWMIQCGFKNTVASMGSHLLNTSNDSFIDLVVKIVLCFDNDEAGRKATERVGKIPLGPSPRKTAGSCIPLPTGTPTLNLTTTHLDVLRQMVENCSTLSYALRSKSGFSSETQLWE